jgi:hypothetical protein
MMRASTPSPESRSAIGVTGDREFEEFIASGSTEGCVAGVSTILRLINTVVAESVSGAENKARTATFPHSVSQQNKC